MLTSATHNAAHNDNANMLMFSRFNVYYVHHLSLGVYFSLGVYACQHLLTSMLTLFKFAQCTAEAEEFCSYLVINQSILHSRCTLYNDNK